MKNIHPLKNTRSLILTYTVLFCVLFAGIFALFIIQGRSFVNHADAYDQGYFWTVELKSNLESLFSGKGYPLWSWYRGTGMDAKLPIDPFALIAALFPIGYIELGYTVAIVLRLYCAGLAFIAFGREVELSNFQCLIGALSYISTTWVINVSLMQGQFINLLVMFPFLAMSVDRIYKGKSPWLFIVSVALTVSFNYYLAYMAAIAIILYILLRYFRYRSFSIKDYSLSIGRFIICGIAGIMISAIFVLVSIQTVSDASTGSSGLDGMSTFYGIPYYLSMGLRWVSNGYSFSYTYIGIPILALIAVIPAIGKPSIKATHSIMAMILFAMTMFPFFGSMFNGFGYISNRWYYILIFFIVWTATEHLDLDKLNSVKNIIVMLLWWIVLTVTTLGFSYVDITGDMSLGQAMFIGGNLAAGFVLILIIASGRKLIPSLRARQTLLVLGTIGALIITWNCSFYNRTGYYFENGAINEQLKASTQRVSNQIDDDGFYRVDQVDWLNIHHRADQPVNENLWWQSNTIYLYDSKLPSALSIFNKLVGNNLGYSKRVYMESNGNRMGLDFLYGIKYFLGDDEKNDNTGSDAYAGYGFSRIDDIDGVHVWKNKYDSGLGFTYDAYITESEFEKLSRLEREQALLQAMVIPDDTAEDMSNGKKLAADDIDTDITDIPYTVTATDNAEIDGSTIRVGDDGGFVTIHVDGVSESQLVVSFDNLMRINSSGKSVGDFYLSCSNSKLTASASNTRNSQTISGIVDYDLNMGYYDSYSGNLKIKFSKAGTYTFDRLYISAMSVDNYDKYASERVKGSYRVSKYSSTKVTGTVEAESDGFLFISIPINGNWSVYIDGVETEKIDDANIAFMATYITEGSHKVELRYDYTNRLIALAITASGVLIAILLCLRHCKESRKVTKAVNESD